LRRPRRTIPLAALTLFATAVGAQEIGLPGGPLPPPGGKLVLEDFEWCEAGKRPPLWTKWGKPEGMEIVARPVEPPGADESTMALCLTGRIVKGGRDPMQCEAARGLPIPALATEVVLTLAAEAPKCLFHVRVADADEETFGYMFSCPAPGERKEVRVRLEEGAAEYHYAGNRDGKMVWPLRLQSMGVAAEPDAENGADFRVYVDEIAATIPRCKAIPIELCDEEGAGGESPWQLDGENVGESAVSLGGDDEHEGLVCTWLDYAWGPGAPRPNSFAELMHPLPLGTGEGTLFAWVKGDGSGTLVLFRIRDAGEELWQVMLHDTFMFWKGWRCLFLDVMQEDQKRLWVSHWGGDNNGVLEPPFTFHSIVFDDWTGPEKLDEVPASPPAGRIGVGPVWYVGWANG